MLAGRTPVPGRVRVVAAAAVLAVTGLVAWQLLHWSDPSITRAASERPIVALTFDDGLNGGDTRATAAILEQFDARGTFFVVGRTAVEQSDLARQLVERGHLIANHSYDHPRASRWDVLYRQIPRAQQAFADTIGACPSFYRPPWGVQTPFVNGAVHRAGMRTVLWDVEVADWDETDSARLAANVLAKVRPGSIILLHDGTEGKAGADHSVMVNALPAILAGLHDRGLTPVRLDDLLGTPGYIDCN